MQNAFNHFGQGWDQAQGVQDQFSRQRAGNALAAGDYQAGGNALLQGGMLEDGLRLQQYGEGRGAADAEAQKAETKERLGFFKQAAGALAQIPDDGTQQHRRAAMQRLMPTFQAMGLPPEVVQQLEQSDLSDASLAAFGAELRKAEEEYTLAPGAQRYRGNQMVADNPRQERPLVVPQGSTVLGPDNRPVYTAPKTYAPQRGGGGGAGLPPPPAGWSR